MTEASETSEWREAASLSDFKETDRKKVDFGEDKQVGIFKVDDEFHAVSIWCSHQKMSMMSGDVIDGQLMCPLHGALFCLKTGKFFDLEFKRGFFQFS